MIGVSRFLRVSDAVLTAREWPLASESYLGSGRSLSRFCGLFPLARSALGRVSAGRVRPVGWLACG